MEDFVKKAMIQILYLTTCKIWENDYVEFTVRMPADPDKWQRDIQLQGENFELRKRTCAVIVEQWVKNLYRKLVFEAVA